MSFLFSVDKYTQLICYLCIRAPFVFGLRRRKAVSHSRRTRKTLVEAPPLGESIPSAAIFTSDNPRHEDPESILDEMVAGLPPEARYLRIADRGEAIRAAAMLARPGDIVLLAGKGHETYQIVGDERRHFDDRQQIEHQFSIHR